MHLSSITEMHVHHGAHVVPCEPGAQQGIPSRLCFCDLGSLCISPVWQQDIASTFLASSGKDRSVGAWVA